MAQTNTITDDELEVKKSTPEDAEADAVFAKFAEITSKLRAAASKPGYEQAYEQLAAEAREVAGEKYGVFLEFLANYDPANIPV